MNRCSILIVVLLAGCVVQQQAYRPISPPLAIAINDTVVLTAQDDRAVPVKIFYPESGAGYPLIVLSHGTFSNRHRYDLIANHWAAQGYVVIVPQHKDADYGVRPTGYEVMQQVVQTRVDDMSQVLDELASIETQVPALAGKFDRRNYIAAGHSIGTQVSMLVTGGRFRTAFNNAVMQSDEARYTALVLISDPGKMRLMPPRMWRASTVPTFMATGTDDYGLMGARGEPTEAQTEILSGGADVLRYELLLDKGDHYFGGLVQKKVDAKPDHEGLAIFNELSVVFLDAVAKDNRRAREHLASVDVAAMTNGRARLIQD